MPTMKECDLWPASKDRSPKIENIFFVKKSRAISVVITNKKVFHFITSLPETDLHKTR